VGDYWDVLFGRSLTATYPVAELFNTFVYQYKKMYWLMGGRSALSIHNQLMMYKQILKTVWTYGIQLWECTKQSNVDIIQRFQNKVVTSLMHLAISETPTSIGTFKWRWLRMKLESFIRSMKERLLDVSAEAIQLVDNSELEQRLKRKKRGKKNLLSWCSEH